MGDDSRATETDKQHNQVEGRLRQELQSIARIVDDMLRDDVNYAETERRVLDACLDATDSVYGMIGVINEHGQYDTTTYNSRTLDDCAFPEALTWELTTGMPIRGVWGWAMLHGEPLICNDLPAHPDRVDFPEGHVPLHSFLGIPLKRDGKVVGMVAVANRPGGYTEEDEHTLIRLAAVMTVSRQHRLALADMRRTTAELARSNKDLEQFAYVASHDLQEPLRIVASYVQLIQRRYRDKLDAEADEFIHFAVDGAQRMQRLIEDLLAYSRVGTQGKEFTAVDFNGVADEVVERLRASIEQYGAAVTRDQLPTVGGDRGQLVRLLQNLVGNGIKFHGAQAPRVHISAEKSHRQWIFSVCDNGIGIDAKFQERVFAVFQRLHTRDEYPGTGIGLAVCKRIVQRHGGEIRFESQPGKGTTFFFTIPDRGVAS